jgi:hypothetical protein
MRHQGAETGCLTNGGIVIQMASVGFGEFKFDGKRLGHGLILLELAAKVECGVVAVF